MQLFIELIKNTLVQMPTPSSPSFVLAYCELTAGREANPPIAAVTFASADVMQ